MRTMRGWSSSGSANGGPDTATAAVQAPVASNTGAAIDDMPAADSSTLTAWPTRRTSARARSSDERDLMVRGPRRVSPACTTASTWARLAERQQALAGRRSVGGPATAEPRRHRDHARALEAVDVDDVGHREHRDVGGETGLRAQHLQRRVGDVAQVEPGDHLLAELVDLEAQAVAAVRGLFDPPRPDERGQQPVDGRLAHPEPAGQFRDAEHGLGEAERRQDVGRLGDGRIRLRSGSGLAHAPSSPPPVHQVTPSNASQQRRVSSAPAM